MVPSIHDTERPPMHFGVTTETAFDLELAKVPNQSSPVLYGEKSSKIAV